MPSPPVHLDPDPARDLSRLRRQDAASLLTTEVARARPDEAVTSVRHRITGRRFATLADVAVVDGTGDGRLVGLVAVEVLLAADGDTRIADVMDPDPPVVGPEVDQETAAVRMVAGQGRSVAVVDDERRLLGLIPPARMLEVLVEEHEEDLARLVGVLHERRGAREASLEPIPRRFWHRLPWLLVGFGGVLSSAGIVGAFEEQLAATILLGVFLPGVVYMADAVGTQTEALAIRGLAVGVPIRAVLRLEVVTGVLIGTVVTALFIPAAALLWGDVRVAVAVGLALLGACSTATAVAIVLPAILTRLGRDPAFGSGPLATVLQDLLSIVIYFLVATALL